MTYAEDQLAQGFMRQNLPRFLTGVRAKEIIPHLHILTQSDRDEIEAKVESSGNYDGMKKLLDYLQRREGWPVVLIRALRECQKDALANDLEAAYNALLEPRRPRNPAPGLRAQPGTPPLQNINRAYESPHVEPRSTSTQTSLVAAPPLGHESASQAPEPHKAASLATEPHESAPLTPEPHESASAASEPNESASPAPEPHESVSLTPEPHESVSLTPEPHESASAASEPHESASPAPEPHESVSLTPEPHESASAAPEPHDSILSDRVPSEANGIDLTRNNSDVNSTTSKTDLSLFPHQASAQTAPYPTETTLATNSFSENYPIQDTSPPSSRETGTQQPTEEPDMTINQSTVSCSRVPDQEIQSQPKGVPVAPRVGPTDRPQCSSMAAASNRDNIFDKPGILESIPQPRVIPVAVLEEPYSGDSGRLELSSHNTNHSALADPRVENRVSEEPTLHNEPEENSFDSVCPSFASGQVQYNVVHVSEDPSIQNNDGQTPSIMGNVGSAYEVSMVQKHNRQTQAVSGNEAFMSNDMLGSNHNAQNPSTFNKEASISAANLSSRAASSNDSVRFPVTTRAQDSTEPSPEEQSEVPLPQSEQYFYLLTATAIGLVALYMAWRLRK